MKIRFECRLILTENIDVPLTDIYSCDDVTKNLIDDLKNSMTSSGEVFVENANMTIEGR